MSTGVQQFEQEEQRGSSIQPGGCKSLDSDIEKKLTSSLNPWGIKSLAKLSDNLKGVFEDSNAISGEPADDDYGTKEHTVPYPGSVVSVSSLELDEHGNYIRQYSDYDRTKNVSLSNQSSCVDIDDIVINIEPPMLTIMKG